jgi:hypothetical protein
MDMNPSYTRQSVQRDWLTSRIDTINDKVTFIKTIRSDEGRWGRRESDAEPYVISNDEVSSLESTESHNACVKSNGRQICLLFEGTDIQQEPVTLWPTALFAQQTRKRGKRGRVQTDVSFRWRTQSQQPEFLCPEKRKHSYVCTRKRVILFTSQVANWPNERRGLISHERRDGGARSIRDLGLTQVKENGREDNIKTVNEINVNEKLVTVILVYYIMSPRYTIVHTSIFRNTCNSLSLYKGWDYNFYGRIFMTPLLLRVIYRQSCLCNQS